MSTNFGKQSIYNIECEVNRGFKHKILKKNKLTNLYIFNKKYGETKDKLFKN